MCLEKVEKLGNGVFQSFIVQHASLSDFPSAAVSTLRLTTVLNASGSPSLRASYLRFGAADDTHVSSKTHIRVPINSHTGETEGVGYTPGWKQIRCYPDSDISFSNFKYPKFTKACALVLALHKNVPFVHSIGWDVCVNSEQEVKLMEWNAGHNDIKFSEATQGPCFHDLGWEKFV